MKVHFHQPPAEKSTGGLALAIDTMASHLREAGFEVQTDADSHAADIVHFHGLWQPTHATAAARCRRLDIPYIVSPHGMLEPWARQHKWWKKRPYYWLCERGFLAKANALLATARQEGDHLHELFPDQHIAQIPLGVPSEDRPDYRAARKRLGWKTGECILVFLARVDPKKGLDLLLQSLAAVQLPAHCRLVIVGGGEARYVQQLEQMISQLQATLPVVEWMGEIWDARKWDYLRGADLFCLTSHSENFGLAVLEACQVGTPVLTSTATPWGEFLNREGGFVVPPDVEEISGALKVFFALPPWQEAQRDSLSRWAFSTFDWHQITRQTIALYTAILSQHKKAG